MAAASGPTEMGKGGGGAGTGTGGTPYNFANKRTEADYRDSLDNTDFGESKIPC